MEAGKIILIAGGALAAIGIGLYLAMTKFGGTCSKSYFYDKLKHLGRVEYTKDNSTLLRQVYDNGEGDYRLTVCYDQMPTDASVYGDTVPPVRTWQAALTGWKAGYELTRELCDVDKKWYWVTWHCLLESITPPPTGCGNADFATGEVIDYNTTAKMNQCGYSGNWKLTVDRGNVLGSSIYGSTMPPERPVCTQVADWNSGYVMERRQCSKDNNWYWVRYSSMLSQTGCSSYTDSSSCIAGGCYWWSNSTCHSIPEVPPEATIVGHVTDALTGQPAWLGIIKFSSHTAYTDTNGYYEIRNPDLVSGYITCEKMGYIKLQKMISAPTTGILTVNFALIWGG